MSADPSFLDEARQFLGVIGQVDVRAGAIGRHQMSKRGLMFAVQPMAIGGGTYARAMEHGVGFGPVFPGKTSTAHEADEHFSVADFEKAFEIYYEAIKELCF